MKTLKFKSNIKCMGCVEKVKPVLDAVAGIHKWQLDIEKPEKILTVESESLGEAEIIKAVAQSGFMAEPLPNTSDKA